MKVSIKEQVAITGITAFISSQEQVVLNDMLDLLAGPIQKHKERNIDKQNKHLDGIRVDATALINLVTFVSKLTAGVPSMLDTYNDLFDINPNEDISTGGKLPLSETI